MRDSQFGFSYGNMESTCSRYVRIAKRIWRRDVRRIRLVTAGNSRRTINFLLDRRPKKVAIKPTRRFWSVDETEIAGSPGLRKCLPLVLEGALSAPQALVEHSLVRALVRLVRQRRRRET